MVELSVSNLTKKYNRKVIFEGLSFTHSKGILGISGSNGSGKSTLMKCLSGLLRANNGDINWKAGNQLLSKTEFKQNIGYAAPYINLYDDLTVLENLEFLAEVSVQNHQVSFIRDLMLKTETDLLKSKLFKSLSTGQQQRAKLAASLIKNPQILFWDEPGSNLDAKGRELVSSIVKQESEKGTCVILASNDSSEISLCDNVVRVGE